ncbi:hypothetical protein BDW59DRAFT_166941 [Aspergillus cavernicola]|uniref:Uncharacterized protein n=1 Tax=Aspergillus cavernicola TaxID=176166 RepID=A0ABR4HHY9_9EURO
MPDRDLIMPWMTWQVHKSSNTLRSLKPSVQSREIPFSMAPVRDFFARLKPSRRKKRKNASAPQPALSSQDVSNPADNASTVWIAQTVDTVAQIQIRTSST